MRVELSDPHFYFPLQHGRYDVAPGLSLLGKDFGAGDADGRLFQIDRNFQSYRHAKLAARDGAVGRYFRTFELGEDVVAQVAGFIARRLVLEHPALFSFCRGGDAMWLHCKLTGERVQVDEPMLDALALQVQEDLAILSVEGGRHWLSAAHVCFPSGWAPAEKVGKSFALIHEPVAGMQEMNRRGDHFADLMVHATDGLVRFAWGVTFDDRLDHHPALPRTPFDPANPAAWLRVERQTIWGFPQVGAALFTIRTYLYDCDTLRRDAATRDPLVAALRSMPPGSRTYKGLDRNFDDLVHWLAAGAGETAQV